MALEKQAILLSIENEVLKDALSCFLSRFYEISDGQNHDLILTDIVKADEKSKIPRIILCKQAQKTVPDENSNVFLFDTPFYAGELLEKMQLILSNAYKFLKKSHISFGAHRINRENNVFIHGETGKETVLTDKECDIFSALFEARGMHLDKKTLLEQVWGYGEGIETHTLETHIYRLRQKIEKDPARPDIILTNDDGYCLRSE